VTGFEPFGAETDMALDALLLTWGTHYPDIWYLEGADWARCAGTLPIPRRPRRAPRASWTPASGRTGSAVRGAPRDPG
jgi:hypothetical protein